MSTHKSHIPLKVLISGGGTGGHLFPALAIAQKLQQRQEGVELLFIGAKGRMEMEKVAAAGYNIIGLDIVGINRKNLLKNLGLPWKIWSSFRKAKKIIKEFDPQVVIGVGGYSSGPVLFAASVLHKPILIQEQNFYPGLTNRLLAKRASKICVAYSGMEKYLPAEKIVLTGNPVRTEIVSAAEELKVPSENPVLLVIGGSLGAKTINQALMKNFHVLKSSGIQFVWQTGKFYYNEILTKLGEEIPSHFTITTFIEDMASVYRKADLVISRAGAISISELAVMGKAVILVPSPNVAADHQTKNARKLEEENAAIMIKDANATESLVNTAIELIHDTNRLNLLKTNIKKLARPDATDRIADEVFKLAGN